MAVSVEIFAQKTIYNENKNYKFKIIYKNDSLNIFTNEIVSYYISGKSWRHSAKQKEAIIKYNYSIEDSLKCKNLFTLGWTKVDTTGIIEDTTRVWFHPVRNNQYSSTEFAAFPLIQYPLELNKKYQKIMFTADNFGKSSNQKFYQKYTVKNRILINNNYFWEIHSEAYNSLNEQNKNILIFLFNENIGFYKLTYYFYDKTYIEMQLID